MTASELIGAFRAADFFAAACFAGVLPPAASVAGDVVAFLVEAFVADFVVDLFAAVVAAPVFFAGAFFAAVFFAGAFVAADLAVDFFAAVLVAGDFFAEAFVDVVAFVADPVFAADAFASALFVRPDPVAAAPVDPDRRETTFLAADAAVLARDLRELRAMEGSLARVERTWPQPRFGGRVANRHNPLPTATPA